MSRALLTLALVSLAGVEAVSAQGPSPLAVEGLREMAQGHFAEARALFLRAYEEEPSAGLLRAAGMASFELREYRRADELLREALQEQRSPLDARLRADAQALRARSATFLGTVELRVEPADAVIVLDGRELDAEGALRFELDGRRTTAQRTVRLDLGEHVLVARAPGYLSEERRVTIVGGESSELSLELRPEEVAPLVVEAEPPPVLASTPSSAAPRGAGLFGTAGVLAGLSVAGGLWWRDRAHELERCRHPGEGQRCSNGGRIRRQRRAATGATTVALIGAVGAAVAGLAVRLGDDTHEMRAVCVPDPAGFGCGISGRF